MKHILHLVRRPLLSLLQTWWVRNCDNRGVCKLQGLGETSLCSGCLLCHCPLPALVPGCSWEKPCCCTGKWPWKMRQFRTNPRLCCVAASLNALSARDEEQATLGHYHLCSFWIVLAIKSFKPFFQIHIIHRKTGNKPVMEKSKCKLVNRPYCHLHSGWM